MADGKTTIMVVDDDSDILNIASRGLELAGYQVHSFSDPVRALQHVESGCERCEVIVSDIKIVMMTAFEVNKTEFESVFPSTPVDRVMRKPFVIAQLAEAIKEIHRSESQKNTN